LSLSFAKSFDLEIKFQAHLGQLKHLHINLQT
jgi:hypothetical protein